jgi:integrase
MCALGGIAVTKEPQKSRSRGEDKYQAEDAEKRQRKASDAVILTAAAIKKYKPSKHRRRIRDAFAKSLFLIVEPSGTKSWQMRFRTPSGRIAKLTLGRVDFSERELKGDPEIGQSLTLPAARQLAAKVHRRRAGGEDVVAAEKAKKHRDRIQVKERENSTFGRALRDYMREHAQANNRRWRQTAWLLGLRYAVDATKDSNPEEAKDGLAQRWGEKDVRDIDAHDIWQAVDEAKHLGVPGIKARNKGLSEARARALFVSLSALFKWLHKQRRIAVNPVPGAYHPEAAKARDRVLSADEIRWFWQATEAVDAPRVTGAPKPFRPLLRLLLLTGARLNEVAKMCRDELHSDDTWRLPGERTKNKKPHVVPLPPLASELIGTMREKGEHVFSTNGGRSPVRGWNRMKRRLDAAMLALAKQEKGNKATIAPWRLHDLRRTAVTGMVELGVPPHVVELVMNHISGTRGGVAGVYNRSEMLPERRAALEHWSARVTGIVNGSPGNVIVLHPRGGAA